jgi:glucokinase
MTKSVLLVDVQEDRASFAVVRPGDRPDQVRGFLCDSQDEMILSLRQAIDDIGAELGAAAFAAPGPVVAGAIQLTHAPLRLEQALLQEALGLHDVRLVNDFSARALAMPLLEESSLEQVGGHRLPGQAPAAALGPSGGLGVAILNPDGFVGWVASAGEGGHACLPAINERQSQVIEQLRRRDPHVSADRVLSDRGLMEVANALGAIDKSPCANTVALLVEAAQAGDAVACEAFALFSQWLGVVAGDLALTAGARSGVYVFSPMILTWGERFDRDLCRAAFQAKGRMSGYVTDIPLFLVTEPHCGLLGLSTQFEVKP